MNNVFQSYTLHKPQNEFYKYINKTKLIYHKLIKLKHFMAFIIQYK